MATGVTPSSPAKAKRTAKDVCFALDETSDALQNRTQLPVEEKKNVSKTRVASKQRQKMKIFPHVSVRSEAKVLDLWTTLTRAQNMSSVCESALLCLSTFGKKSHFE